MYFRILFMSKQDSNAFQISKSYLIIWKFIDFAYFSSY
ncbi:hypothetical protein LEP1GSC192_3731 [Leptospira sp. B5-022]|nr:hypothetical protein LEP1GSC192_3731 [Leptospira sp. B5-022]